MTLLPTFRALAGLIFGAILCHPLAAQIDPALTYEPGITQEQFRSALAAIGVTDGEQTAALEQMYQDFASRYRADAAAIQGQFQDLMSRREAALAQNPDDPTFWLWRDYGSILVSWQKRRRALVTELEQQVDLALSEPDREAWRQQTARFRRGRVLPEIDPRSRQQSLQDLVAIIDEIDIAQIGGMPRILARYSTEMDSALQQWEGHWDTLLLQQYENRGQADANEPRRLEELKRLHEEQNALLKAVQEVNARFIPEIASALDEAHQAAFLERVNARDQPDLYATSPVDAAVTTLRDNGSITGEQLAAVEAIYMGYLISRNELRQGLVKAHREWMRPEAIQERIARREELLAAQQDPFESLLGHPGLPDMRGLFQLEARTCEAMRGVFNATDFEHLPVESRLLLVW